MYFCRNFALIGLRFLVLLVALFVTGCGGGSSSDLAPFQAFKNDKITAGKGWAGLQIKKTRLSELVDKFGVSKVSALLSDDQAIEISYGGGQVCVVFMVDPETLNAAGTKSDWYKMATRDLKGFLKAQPAFGNLTLTSLALSAGSTKKNTFYTGKTDTGISLWDNVIEADRQKTDSGAFVSFLAGNPNPDTDRTRPILLSGGMTVFYEGEYQSIQQKLQGGKLSAKEKLVLETALSLAMENSKILRIAVY